MTLDNVCNDFGQRLPVIGGGVIGLELGSVWARLGSKVFVFVSVCEYHTRVARGLYRRHTATHCNTLQHTATHCNALQHTATHSNTLQLTATHCNTLQQSR